MGVKSSEGVNNEEIYNQLKAQRIKELEQESKVQQNPKELQDLQELHELRKKRKTQLIGELNQTSSETDSDTVAVPSEHLDQLRNDRVKKLTQESPDSDELQKIKESKKINLLYEQLKAKKNTDGMEKSVFKSENESEIEINDMKQPDNSKIYEQLKSERVAELNKMFQKENIDVNGNQIDNKETVADNIDAPVDTATIDTETDFQKIIRERNENMPDNIDDNLIDKDLEKNAQEIKDRAKKEFPELAEIIEDGKKPIQELLDAKEIQNLELKEILGDLGNRLTQIDKKADGTLIEITTEEDKEKAHKTLRAIGKFIRSPKGQMAILAGVGAMAFTAGGGAVPAIMLLKPILVKYGILSAGYTIPYAYGLSTGVAAAFAGGAAGKFMEKIGLIKDKKDNREILKEFAFGVKGAANNENIASGQQINETRPKGQNQSNAAVNRTVVGETKPGNTENAPERRNNSIASPEDAMRYYEENKDKNNNELNLGDIEKMMKAIEKETTMNPLKVLFSDKKRESNNTYNWLVKKKNEIKKQENISKENIVQQPPEIAIEPAKGKEKIENSNSEDILSAVNEMENLIIGFKKGEASGKELLEYVRMLEELRKKYGDEEAKLLIGKIQGKTYSFDEKTRGQIVDAMIEYAREQKMKPSEVLDYVTYFENVNHIGKVETYRWLMGKEKETEAGEKMEKVVENEKAQELEEKVKEGLRQMKEKNIEPEKDKEEISLMFGDENIKRIRDAKNFKDIRREIEKKILVIDSKKHNILAKQYSDLLEDLRLFLEAESQFASHLKSSDSIKSNVLKAGNENVKKYVESFFNKLDELKNKRAKIFNDSR